MEDIKILVILSVFPSLLVSSVYMMTHNGNDVIAPTAQAATLAVTFPSLCSEVALPSPSPFLVVSCGCRCCCICSLVGDMHSHNRLLVTYFLVLFLNLFFDVLLLVFYTSSLLGLPEICCATIECSAHGRAGVYECKDQCKLF